MDNRKAQKYLLIGFEKLVETFSSQLLLKTPHILKAFYDNDILEEETILEWADKVQSTSTIIHNSQTCANCTQSYYIVQQTHIPWVE